MKHDQCTPDCLSKKRTFMFYSTRFSIRSVAIRFVAKRYILQQKCLKGQIATFLLGTRWYNF